MSDYLQEDLNFGISLDKEPKSTPPLSQAKPSFANEEVRSTKATTDEAVAASTTDKYDLKRAGHPTACIATFIFKVIAIVWYLLIGNFISDIMTFIFVIVFSALDFWTVKNVTGRLLVGLRWWSENNAEGKEEWKFESREGKVINNPVDKAFFWTSQLAGTGIWAVLLLLKVLTLSIFWVNLLLI